MQAFLDEALIDIKFKGLFDVALYEATATPSPPMGIFFEDDSIYNEGDFWLLTTSGEFEGLALVRSNILLATGGMDMDFSEVVWRKIPVSDLVNKFDFITQLLDQISNRLNKLERLN